MCDDMKYDSVLTLHDFHFDSFSDSNRGILNGDVTTASDIPFEKFTFPDGSGHIKLTHVGDNPLIVASPSNMGEVLDIVLAADAISRLGIYPVSLAMPYFLGSRQDRVCVPGEPLTSKVVADLINSCMFRDVYIWHPHSQVTPALLDGVVVMPGIGRRVIFSNKWPRNNGVLVAPDAGAVKMVHELSAMTRTPMVSAEKVRDMNTGKIIQFALYATRDQIAGKDVMIVDDALTNGGTFIGLLREIEKLRPRSVSLCVTHADHREGVLSMAQQFDKVFISNSRSWVKRTVDSDRVHVIYLNFKG